jgi:hypothetical protein
MEAAENELDFPGVSRLCRDTEGLSAVWAGDWPAAFRRFGAGTWVVARVTLTGQFLLMTRKDEDRKQ